DCLASFFHLLVQELIDLPLFFLPGIGQAFFHRWLPPMVCPILQQAMSLPRPRQALTDHPDGYPLADADHLFSYLMPEEALPEGNQVPSDDDGSITSFPGRFEDVLGDVLAIQRLLELHE